MLEIYRLCSKIYLIILFKSYMYLDSFFKFYDSCLHIICITFFYIILHIYIFSTQVIRLFFLIDFDNSRRQFLSTIELYSVMLEATKSFPLHIYLIKYKSKHTSFS